MACEPARGGSPGQMIWSAARDGSGRHFSSSTVNCYASMGLGRPPPPPPAQLVFGCMDRRYPDYNPAANTDDGSCGRNGVPDPRCCVQYEGCCAPPPPENPGEMVSAGDVQAVITQQRASVSGYDTYRVAVSFDSSVVQDVYALYGDLRGSGSPLIFPPAWQAPSPFGSNVGPVNPALYAAMPDAEYDSFLTIGIDGPATQSGALSSVGIDFEAWTERDGITANDGGEFSDTAASLERMAHFV